jgi:hypothetical protein
MRCALGVVPRPRGDKEDIKVGWNADLGGDLGIKVVEIGDGAGFPVAVVNAEVGGDEFVRFYVEVVIRDDVGGRSEEGARQPGKRFFFFGLCLGGARGVCMQGCGSQEREACKEWKWKRLG